MKIIDFDTSDRVEHAVFGGKLVPLTAEAIHALSLNAQVLAGGEAVRESSDSADSRGPQRPLRH